MPNLNVRFSGLFLWVSDASTGTMYVLAPPTDTGTYRVEPHVSRLQLPGAPQLYDIATGELRLGSGGIGTADLSHHFDCSHDGGRVEPSFLAPGPSSAGLQNRFVLGAGAISSINAPIDFYIGAGATQCIASEVVWTIPLDATQSIRLEFTSAESGMPILAPFVLQAVNGQDIDIMVHHVPPGHLPGGGVGHPALQPLQPAKHLPALYNLMLAFQTILVPLTTGGLCRSGGQVSIMGGDPVTCGQGTAALQDTAVRSDRTKDHSKHAQGAAASHV